MTDILIVGAGALGSYFASRFADAGMDMVLIARGARLEAIRREGVLLDLDGQLLKTEVCVRSDCLGLDEAAAVLFCTKDGDLASAMEVVAEAIGPETILLTVQNGVDAPGEVAARFPRATVLAARQHGFFQVEDGVVRHVGVAPSILFGPVDKGDGNAATRMLSMFTQAAIPAALSADMLADLWAKLVLVSALGAWGAATGMSAGDLKHDSIAATQLEAAMDEVAGLARLKGVTLPADIVARTLGFVSKFPDDAKPSMQRDIEAGRSSEYESLTGAVIRMADELGLDVPVHRRLDTMIRARFFG